MPSILCLDILLNTQFLNTHDLCSFLSVKEKLSHIHELLYFSVQYLVIFTTTTFLVYFLNSMSDLYCGGTQFESAS
jgi:hypothetical protein